MRNNLLAAKLILMLCMMISTAALAQEMTVDEYIARYSDLAVSEMKKYGIPASITLAQGILESGSGNSTLARKANNHFGIKCHKEWTGKTFHQDDDAKNECFRKYDSPEDSYRDHSLFLATRDRYDFLFLLDITDYKSWAYGLKKAGYATNPLYPELLIGIIEENELYRYDTGEGKRDKSPVVSHQSSVSESGLAISKPYESIPFGTGGGNRQIFLNNEVKFVIARKGDTWYGLADEFGIYGWQIRKYNELKKKDEIKEGEIIYLERKRNRGAVQYHTVQKGDDLRNISQRYAVKEKVLRKMNGLKKGEELQTGSIIILD